MTDERIMNDAEQAASDAAVAAFRAANAPDTEAIAKAEAWESWIRETFATFALANIVGFYLPTQAVAKVWGYSVSAARYASGTPKAGGKGRNLGPQGPFHADYVSYEDKGRSLGDGLFMAGDEGLLTGGLDGLLLGLAKGNREMEGRWGDAGRALLAGEHITKAGVKTLFGFYQIVQGEDETTYTDVEMSSQADFDAGAKVADAFFDALKIPMGAKATATKRSKDIIDIRL